MAIATRISTGTSVQTTSRKVLWVVRDGTGLAPRRNLTITISRRRRTKAVITVMIGISSLLWNQSASWPIGVTCGWKLAAPVGWPTVASGAVRARLLDRT